MKTATRSQRAPASVIDASQLVRVGAHAPASREPPPEALRRPLTAAVGGIGQGTMIPPQDCQFGMSLLTLPVPLTLSWAWAPAFTQTATCRIDGTFYVYHEVVGGVDDYLVIYMEDGTISPGTLIENTSDARGYSLCEYQNTITPTSPADGQPFASGANWISSSPATVDQVTSTQTMVVDQYSQTVTVQASSEGSSVSSSTTESVQLWNSETRSIADWGVNEQSNGVTNMTGWQFHQQAVWDPLVDAPADFGSWWQRCYDDDGVKPLPDLSVSSFQYHTTSAWRFARSMAASDGTLWVKFVGTQTYGFAALTMPGYAGTGHHQLAAPRASSGWSWTIDLAALAALDKSK